MPPQNTLPLGATLQPDGTCTFLVWAPRPAQLTLRLMRGGATQELPMQREGEYFTARAAAAAGDRYLYVLPPAPNAAPGEAGLAVPDPVSRSLPEGVHRATEIVNPAAFAWTDTGWRGLPREHYIIYELHVGTFTPEGTFDAAIPRLRYLREQLGVTAIEIMPVSAFPHDAAGKGRNWGYDGVSSFAPDASYGGPDALKRLVDAAHNQGLAVVMDVVYNHFGNEGNYTGLFAPYFTARHKTPWGDAIDYDSPTAHGVREFVVENAKYWISEFHLDALRLDAVQTIYDDSPRHILAEISENVATLARELGREVVLFAESDLNESQLVTPVASGGRGMDAFWSDDFHHAMHALLTGEREGYYQDFGKPRQVVRALNDGYVFQGEMFDFWKRGRGTPAKDVPLPANVICIQNHDQVGNRAQGERLTVLCSWGQRRAAAALLLLAPHTPLLFMGQEYDEPAPFQFFTSYGDPALVEAVRKGRAEEFREFTSFSGVEVPDPQAESTFQRSKLDWSLATPENEMLQWYAALIALRKQYVFPLATADRRCHAEIHHASGGNSAELAGEITMEVPAKEPRLRVVVSLNDSTEFEDDTGWERLLSAQDQHCSVAVYRRS